MKTVVVVDLVVAVAATAVDTVVVVVATVVAMVVATVAATVVATVAATEAAEAAVVAVVAAGVVEGTSYIANRQCQTVVSLPAYDRKFGQPRRRACDERARAGLPSSSPPSARVIYLHTLPYRMSDKT